MKVLMISKSQVVGAYHGKLRELANLGVDLTVITPPRWGNQVLEIHEARGYRLRVVPCLLSGYTHFHFYTASLGPFDADLIHLEEEPWSLVTQQVMRLARRWRKPTIFFTWQNILKTYPPPFNLIERNSFAFAKAAIAGNEEAKNVLRAKGFSKPISIIPQLGVDPEFFKKAEALLLRRRMTLEHHFVIGYVGRIIKEKGVGDLIAALAKLPVSCALVLVGEGKFRGDAERLAQRLRVSSRIRWVSQVASLDIPQYMNLFDILVLPSLTTPRWKEQFGRVLVEAMACGTPPIGSSSGEIPNVIGDGGLVFPEGNTETLAAQIRSLLEHPSHLSALAEKGRERVLRRFTHRRIAEQTVQFYSRVLEGFSTQTECVEQTNAPSYFPG